MEAKSVHAENDCQSHMHRLLLIPEILALVFSYLDPKSLSHIARVSRLWNAASLDYLWQNLDQITGLLRVFGPVVAEDFYIFELVPDGSGNPQRFLDLAKKVRSLEQTLDSVIVKENWFNIIKSHFGAEIDCIFPRLRHLQWVATASSESLNRLFPFLCPPSIRTVRLTVLTWGMMKDDTFVNIFRAIGGVLSSSLTAFEVDFYPARYECDVSGGSEIAGAVTGAVAGWENLTSLSLREIYIHPVHAELLLQGQLPLRRLLLSVLGSAGPSLSYVSDVVAQYCTSLRCLHLCMDEMETAPIQFHHLAHLLACRSLTELQIFHCRAIHIDTDAVHRMGDSWRDMEILNLVTTIDEAMNWVPPTPCCRLLDFAAAMPKLEKLGMFFSYTEVPPTLEHLYHTFQRLRVLGVGPAVALPREVPRLGQFLRAICPPGAKIACSYDSLAEPVFNTDWKRTASRECWVEVQNMMDFGQ